MRKQYQLFETELKNSGATFSPCRKYRYALWRIWDERLPYVMFIGLNPSRADEKEADPTITRVINFAKNWCYGGVFMMNLFAYVTPYPEELIKCTDNSRNDFALKLAAVDCDDIVYAYGNFKIATDRAKEVREMLRPGKALVLNKNGTPRHPLYVPANVKPVFF